MQPTPFKLVDADEGAVEFALNHAIAPDVLNIKENGDRSPPSNCAKVLDDKQTKMIMNKLFFMGERL